MRGCSGLGAVGGLASILLWLAAPSAAALTRVQSGMKAPWFVLKTIDGRPYDLEKNLGSGGTVVVFWATWSVGSPRLLDRLQKVFLEHGARGLSVVAVNVDNQTLGPEDRKTIRQFVVRHGLTFSVVLDNRLSTFHQYGVVAVPSTVLLDEKGTVLFELSGYPLLGSEQLFDRIAERLGLRPPSPARRGAEEEHPAEGSVRKYNLGRQMLAKGMPDLGVRALAGAVAEDPKFVPPVLLLAQIHREAGRVDEAERVLAKALKARPGHVNLVAELARVRLVQGRTADAAALLADAVRTDPDYAPAHCYLGLALKQMGDPEGALKECRTAQSLNPHNPDSFELSAATLESLGRVKESAADYRRAVELLAGY